MARGKELHAARLAAVSALGKTLTRRARSKCELCSTDAPLKVIEVEPLDEDPHDDAAILACERCRTAIGGRSPDLEPTDSGFLQNYSQLKPGRGDQAQLVFIDPNADFSPYEKVLIDPVVVWEPSASGDASDEKLRKLAGEGVPWATDVLDGLWIDETVEAQLERLE